MADARARLESRLAQELSGAPSAETLALAEAIRARHGTAVAAVIFYGSCRRRRSSEGVHDFYVVVDGYRAAYASRALAAANALLPPNVFYVELEREGVTLRAKYAVVSHPDLARACRGRTRRSGAWARFAQPLRAAYLRDGAARDALVSACADAVCTALRFGLARRGARWQRVESAVFWRELFRATYADELRPERNEAIDSLYGDEAPRFDAVLDEGLAVLHETGDIERSPDWARLRTTTRRHRAASAKALAGLQLLKSAVTFGDWLPYALWKLERHSGLHLEPSERQRRHPWLFAWPLFFRALRSRALR